MKNFNIDSFLHDIYSKPLEDTNRPVIGITCNAQGEDYSIRQKYIEKIEKGGGVPLLLSPTEDILVILQQLDIIDGIIFSGGGDYNPLWSGEEPSPQLHTINPVRDSHELTLCRLAYNRNIPMLGICRGMQTMAIALGGHVCQDIGDSPSPISGGMSRIKHSQDAPKSEPTHSVELTKCSSLYKIYNEDKIYVNSFHHQYVDKTGKKFRAIAKSPDGITEGMESTEYRSLLAVQWHPEQLGEEGLKIFRWLTKEAEIFRKAKNIHKQILTIDSHCDTPMFFPQNIDFISRDPHILYDLYKMNEGHIDAVNMVCYLPQPKFGEGWKSPLETTDSLNNGTALSPKGYTDLIFDKIEEICRKQPTKLSIAKTPQELYRDKRNGRHSIMIGIENGLALEHDIKNIEHFKQRGITYITLCHNGDNDICDSARGCQTHNGVSSFGKRVIAEMNRLGVIVDMSHAAESSFYDALEYSSKPIVCSHSNCRSLCDHPRNLTDDQMHRLSERGGVMQLTMYHGFLNSGEEASIEDFLCHLDYAIKIMGIDHVGIGTDFDGDGGILGCASASELLNITIHLIRRGYSDRDIEKIWGRNWLRVMAENQAN